MYRVELKEVDEIIQPIFKELVPNVPCGVESNQNL